MSGTGDPQVADQVLRYISSARWFAGKGGGSRLRSLTPLPWLTEVSEFFGPAAPPAVRFEIAELPIQPRKIPSRRAALSPREDLEPQDSAPAATRDGPCGSTGCRPSITSSRSPTGPRLMRNCTTRRSVVSPILILVRHRVRRRPGPRRLPSDSQRAAGRPPAAQPGQRGSIQPRRCLGPSAPI